MTVNFKNNPVYSALAEGMDRVICLIVRFIQMMCRCKIVLQSERGHLWDSLRDKMII